MVKPTSDKSALTGFPRSRRRTDRGLVRGLLLLLLTLTALVPGPSLLAAEISAQLDRNAIVEGETVTLVIQTDDPKQSLETDLDRLAADFNVIDQRTETQMSIVNGRQSATVRLLLTLEPKRAGRLTIPSLEFRGGTRTAPQLLSVDRAPELAPGELPPVFIEVEVDPVEGPYYVHAQLSLKVRIFYQQNLTEAAINPPAPDQASVRLLDEVPFQADRDGTRYRVLERRYAIFPERSGELVIPPLQLTGRLIERPADRLWQPSVRGRRVRIDSDPVTLDILPRPAQFQGDSWLPARSVTLAQQITDGDSITVGEPVTRTVILDAVGLEEHMLEAPVWPELANARIYPDQPQGISRDDGEWVLGHREYRYAVVPEEPGELVLPQLRLSWWDTVNDRQREAILPEHRVTVLPSALTLPPQGISSAEVAPSTSAGVDGPSAWPWQLLSLLLGMAWLLTLFLLLRRKPSAASGTAPVTGAIAEGEKVALKALRQAAVSKDARAAHLALGRWLRHHGPARAGGSLMGLAELADDAALAAAIRGLDAHAYGQAAGTDWQGGTFWTAFEGWQKAGAPLRGLPGAAPGDLDIYAAGKSA